MYQIILFWNDTLHVSNDLSGHRQEFKTVHKATGICQTDTDDCREQYLFDKCLLLYVQSRTPGSDVPRGGWRVQTPPHENLKAFQNRAKINPIVKTVKNC